MTFEQVFFFIDFTRMKVPLVEETPLYFFHYTITKMLIINVAYIFDFTVNGSVHLAAAFFPGLYVITPELCIIINVVVYY